VPGDVPLHEAMSHPLWDTWVAQSKEQAMPDEDLEAMMKAQVASVTALAGMARPAAVLHYAQAALALTQCFEALHPSGEFLETAEKCRLAVERILAEDAAPAEQVKGD